MRKAAEIKEAFADRSKLDGCKSFFLVGIGGAGMSALARMLKHRGFSVEGTDSTQSPETDRLQAEGISVRIGHSAESISDKHAVVLTDAIDLSTSPEVARAREIAAPLFRRSQVLGWLLRDNSVIAITGTHGKTTTTGMIGAGLKAAGLDPLIVVGASVPEFGGPVVEGKGKWAVVEACEAYDSFHDITPNIVVLTNLELDHVDYHGNWENLRDSVVRFVESIDDQSDVSGFFYNTESEGSLEVAGLVFAGDCCFEKAPFGLVPFIDDGGLGKPVHDPLPPLRLPGDHNRNNAEGALLACLQAGADEPAAARGIANFSGAERRLQVLQDEPITVVDDYAHHPTEIEASLSALNDRYPFRRLIVVYQPHLYSRTEPLIQEFADALSLADEVVITDIYPAREDPIPGVSSARIAELIKKPVHYIPNRHLLPRKVAAMVRTRDVIVGMGAGNIAEFAPALISELRRGCPSRNLGETPMQTHGRDARATKIAVVYGGDSAEREVSLLSGRCVYDALKRNGYDANLVDLSELLIRSGDLSQFTGPDRPDLAFLAVHGTNAEDGAIQGLFELLHIPYTGSGVQASALAMDKQITKTLLLEKGIRVPEGVLISNPDQLVPLKAPLIVKPNAQGSTVGLSFVERDEDLKPAILRALQYDGAVLVEEWVLGMEISVPVLGDRALPPVEIAPLKGKYDFESKYTPGATEEIVPARLPEAILKQAQEIALAAHRALGCEGATRTDMIVPYLSPQPPSPFPGQRTVSQKGPARGNGERGYGDIYTLEVNTLPGMTATSLLPNSARAAGIEFDDLVHWLVEDAMKRHAAKT